MELDATAGCTCRLNYITIPCRGARERQVKVRSSILPLELFRYLGSE